jgi:hypothetical protein
VVVEFLNLQVEVEPLNLQVEVEPLNQVVVESLNLLVEIFF